MLLITQYNTLPGKYSNGGTVTSCSCCPGPKTTTIVRGATLLDCLPCQILISFTPEFLFYTPVPRQMLISFLKSCFMVFTILIFWHNLWFNLKYHQQITYIMIFDLLIQWFACRHNSSSLTQMDVRNAVHHLSVSC